MTLEDVQGLSRAMAPVVADAIKAATAPLIERIAELERRPTAEEVEVRVERAVRAAVEALPVPKDGADGRDGVDGRDGENGEPGRDAEPVPAEAIAAAVEHALSLAGGDRIGRSVRMWLEENPPAAGRDGERGEKGADGADGRDGKDAEPVSDKAIEAAVAKWLAANPPAPGQDGRDGVDGKDGEPGRDGADGEKGAPGNDGVGLAGALINRDGGLVVTLTDGTTRDLGPVVGKDGADGKDGERGAPGFSLTDFEVEQPDLRTLSLSFTAGDTKHTYEVALGGFLDRGTYKAGETYELGDCVTWGGQFWVAQGPTTEKPGGNDDWRLAVRRGRDGKDGLPGKDGERGPPGRDGK